MSTNPRGDVMVENPAWENARKALQGIDPVKSEDSQMQTSSNSTQNNYPPSNPPHPPQPPFQFGYNPSYNFNQPAMHAAPYYQPPR